MIRFYYILSGLFSPLIYSAKYQDVSVIRDAFISGRSTANLEEFGIMVMN